MIEVKTIQNLAEERIKDLDNGLFIVELTVSPKNVISIELDKIGGPVSVNDCVSVSRNVEHNLDREEADFELHVSSAGVDKPLRHPKQFIKNIGRSLEVFLKDGTQCQGKYISLEDEVMTLEIEKVVKEKNKKINTTESIQIQKKDIREAKVIISFK